MLIFGELIFEGGGVPSVPFRGNVVYVRKFLACFCNEYTLRKLFSKVILRPARHESIFQNRFVNQSKSTKNVY